MLQGSRNSRYKLYIIYNSRCFIIYCKERSCHPPKKMEMEDMVIYARCAFFQGFVRFVFKKLNERTKLGSGANLDSGTYLFKLLTILHCIFPNALLCLLVSFDPFYHGASIESPFGEESAWICFQSSSQQS